VEQLNESIQTFLRLLVPYFLLPATGHCLELLIRRYEVQHYNATALLAAFLPYHATNHYVRIIQLVSLPKEPLWEWLAPSQVPPTLDPVYRRRVSNRASPSLRPREDALALPVALQETILLLLLASWRLSKP
jgi:hypothetical protein